MGNFKRYPSYSYLRAIYQTIRPTPSAIAGIITASSLLIYTKMPILWCFLRALPIVLVTMAGFVLNDIYDREKDRMRFRDKPISTGKLPVNMMKLSGVIALFSSIVIEMFFRSTLSLSVIIVTICGVILYSPVAHRAPIVKGLYTSMLCCAPFLYGATISGHSFPFRTYVILCIFVTGRELFLDYRHLREDLAFGIRTAAAYLGGQWSKALSWGLMWVGVVLLAMFANTSLGKLWGIATILALSLCTLVARESEESASRVTRLVILFGSLALSTTA